MAVPRSRSVIAEARAAQSSKIDGVQIGAITYSFRGRSNGGCGARYATQCRRRSQRSRADVQTRNHCRYPPDAGAAAGWFGGAGSGRGGGGRGAGGGSHRSPTVVHRIPLRPRFHGEAAVRRLRPVAEAGRNHDPEQEAAQKKVAEWKWRQRTTWKGVRKKFNDAGVDIQILATT